MHYIENKDKVIKKVRAVNSGWRTALDADLPTAGGSPTQKFPTLNGASSGHWEAGSPVMYGRIPL